MSWVTVARKNKRTAQGPGECPDEGGRSVDVEIWIAELLGDAGSDGRVEPLEREIAVWIGWGVVWGVGGGEEQYTKRTSVRKEDWDSPYC